MTDDRTSGAAPGAAGRLGAEQALATERLIGAMALPDGARVLDIGCGDGPAAIAAARRGAKVTGIDLNEAALERARSRAAAAGFGGIDFLCMDATGMAFDDGSFDVVVSTQGIVFVPDQAAAARELARVVRPGGAVLLTAHTTNSIAAQVYELVNDLAGDPDRPAIPHYAWSRGPRAAELLSPWFDDLRIAYDRYESRAESPEALVSTSTRSNPNIRRVLERLPDDQAARLRDGYLAIVEGFNRATDGSYLADMDFAVITGTRRP